MGRMKNDGRGRIGGRAKGTPNRPAEPLNSWITGVINRNRARFEADLEAMQPAERAGVLAALIVNQTAGGAAPQE